MVPIVNDRKHPKRLAYLTFCCSIRLMLNDKTQPWNSSMANSVMVLGTMDSKLLVTHCCYRPSRSTKDAFDADPLGFIDES